MEEAPLIGIPACTEQREHTRHHRVSEKYIVAAIEAAGGLPLLIPALPAHYDLEELVARLDGLLLTGSPSNVEPARYGGPPSRDGTLHDPRRDALTLPLIRTAIAKGLPLFAICLGVQELNVARGGTLHQNVHELPGKRDHRMRRDLPYEERYAERHPVRIAPGGVLHRLTGGAEEVMVNSLHAQAIDRPGEGVFVEAVSDDGVIEAISVPEAPAFTLGVQWHPEHRVALKAPLSQAMFRAFGAAARARRLARQTGLPSHAA